MDLSPHIGEECSCLTRLEEHPTRRQVCVDGGVKSDGGAVLVLGTTVALHSVG